MLVVIGQRWASVRDPANPEGPPRLMSEDDHVRIEVATALGMPGLTVIPVLVDDAEMPAAASLPPDLQQLLTINGRPVRNNPDFDRDIERLIREIVALASPAASRG